MIERLAIILWKDFCPGIVSGPEDRAAYQSAIIRIIKGMREPTEKMLNDGMWIAPSGEIVGSEGAREVWQNMIDAILGSD